MHRDPAPKVARLPATGVVLFATDLHGNYSDYLRLVALYERERAAGNEPVLVLCGDLVHGPSPDLLEPGAWRDHLGTPYRDESIALLRDYMAFSLEARTLCLMGNHEHAHVGGPPLGKFHEDEAAALEASLAPAEVAAVRAFFMRLPLFAVSACGAVFTHAAPARAERCLEDYEALSWSGYENVHINLMISKDTLGALLWARYAEPGEAQAFLGSASSDGVPKTLVGFGHDVVRSGYEKVGAEQICVSTSYGLLDENKTYLRLDLAARYRSVDDLREGVEILRLY